MVEVKQGLLEKNKNKIMELYNRKGELYTKARKANLEIVPLLSEIAKKRDQHFVGTQNCVGIALADLSVAVSMLVDFPEDLDEDIFTDYLSWSDPDRCLPSTISGSFITPQLNKNIKSIVDAILMYGFMVIT